MDSYPIVFGETLFDVFPDGQRVLGGAPLNVAWHLQAFGQGPRFVGRVGDDEPGREIFQRMTAWGLSTDAVQVDPSHPTGVVRVEIRDNSPSFHIEPEQAYDFIDPEQTRGLGRQTSGLLYHGTLALRTEPSRQALEAIGIPEGGILCDINLRAPWWSRQLVDWSLQRATWIKLNDDELAMLTGRPTGTPRECRNAAAALSNLRADATLIVTRGADGVLGIYPDGEVIESAARVSRAGIVDTVGAGDAFSSVLILGIVHGWERRATLDRASDFAAAVCRRQGAIGTDPAFYQSRLEEWIL